MSRYRRYLISNVKVPRSTLCMRRKRRENAIMELRSQNIHVMNVESEGHIRRHETLGKEVLWGVCETEDSRTADENASAPASLLIDENEHSFSADSRTMILDDDNGNSNLRGRSPTITPISQGSEEEEQSPLCSHTQCTANDVMLMCLALSFRHSLTWVAMTDILKMINTIFGDKVINASKYSIMKTLQEKESKMSYHVYCPTCSFYIGKTEQLKGCMLCQSCKKDIDTKIEANYFMTLSLESQLKQLLQDSNMAEMILNYRFSRAKENSNNLEDIYDGSVYKRLSSHGNLLSYPENFSYSFFTDGVALGKQSRKKTLWPIYISINELPPKERRKHILLCGLYVGPEDPEQSVFLKPFVEEANKLSKEGFTWIYNGKEVISKVIPLIAIADSVARCKLLNLQTFSAHYGCTFCYQKQTRTTKRLKFTIPATPVQERTVELHAQDLVKVYEQRFASKEGDRVVRGVKGPSCVQDLNYFNLFEGVVVDYMHNIPLGVVKTYFTLITDSTRMKFWYTSDSELIAMEDVLSTIDERLKRIMPPSSISRTPRSVKEVTNWRANEWRSFLLFYGIPCLKGVLKKKYLIHIGMLSKATYLLLQKSVSFSDVEEAHRLLLLFSYNFQKFFGEEHMYYNIHLLSHICKGVLNYGSIWTHNAFMFEAKNRQLLKLSKNPHSVVQEISTRYLILKALPQLCQTLATTDDTLFFCEDILEQKLVRFVLGGSCILLGKAEPLIVDANEKCLLAEEGLDSSVCQSFKRMIYNGMRLTTSLYALGKKNNDSVVMTSDERSYVIQKICVQNEAVVLLAREILLVNGGALHSGDVELDHLREVSEYGRFLCLRPECIFAQCVFIETLSGTFLSKMPYGCYVD